HASSAAAGMLAPGAEAAEPGPFLALGLRALGMHRALAAALQDETGIAVEYVPSGVLRPARADDHGHALRSRIGWLQAAGATCAWLDADALRDGEPNLAEDCVGGLLLPNEGHVLPTRLTEALAAAAVRAGARIQEGAPVTGLLRAGDRVVGVKTAFGDQPAGVVVLAAGAWSSLVAHDLAWLPVAPVKGQILSLQPRTPVISRVVFGPDVYLVPRLDGTVTVGATVERVGYDTTITAAGVASLLTSAVAIVPALSGAAFVRAWSGLRPAAPDPLPIIGPVMDGLIAATGHYRNGILLAPLTAELVAAYALGEALPPLAEAVSPRRFQASSVTDAPVSTSRSASFGPI
ncbi:MAG: glycine oxidase ThiO, partial [Dehalococcoidia bacterium]|nr:glycine oxidase ThiO [Dehalococcoidia bacterium]